MFLLIKLRDVLRAPGPAFVGENLPLLMAASMLPSLDDRDGVTFGTSKVWRCFREAPVGGSNREELEVDAASGW